MVVELKYIVMLFDGLITETVKLLQDKFISLVTGIVLFCCQLALKERNLEGFV